MGEYLAKYSIVGYKKISGRKVFCRESDSFSFIAENDDEANELADKHIHEISGNGFVSDKEVSLESLTELINFPSVKK